MRHRCAYRKLGRDTAGRRQLFLNQMSSLFLHERIISTLPKVKELRRVAERTITIAKKGSQQGLLKLSSFFTQEKVLDKLYGTLRHRYASRSGGYTRIIRIGYRERDKAPLGMIELVDSPFEYKKALSLFEKLKLDKGAKFCSHPVAPIDEKERVLLANRGMLPKTHNSYMYRPIAHQYLIDHLHLKSQRLTELTRQRKLYFDSRLTEIYKREVIRKYKPGWSLPLKGPSYLDSIILQTRSKLSNLF